MSHWLLSELEEARQRALKLAGRVEIYRQIYHTEPVTDMDFIRRIAEGLELAVLDLAATQADQSLEDLNVLRASAADAFRLYRVVREMEDPLESSIFKLRVCALGVLGDMGPDASRLLTETGWADLPLDSDDWSLRTWATIVDVWLRLIRKRGWADRDLVLERINALRLSQAQFEESFLESRPAAQAKSVALELVALYHLAKAAEVFAYYMTDGVVDQRNHQIHQLLDTHFDRVMAACSSARMLELEPLARLLAACSSQMADNSIWTVTRAVNSRVTRFVRTLVDRGRGERAIFEMLPPQRSTLAERGLLGSSRRAVVVSLPTSSGKTLIAQFRILQALNQFDNERGWVAYLAPTRTLVNQITRQLRRDFSPMNVVVEQVSPALEIDSIEERLLHETDSEKEFQVLVTTPEKLNLMLRGGIESEIGRPLTLVIVDEAHNIQDGHRGLTLELLLATINNECRNAQFLLLTPFIQNAVEVAKWLGGNSSDDVSFSVEWQPNDRVIGIVKPERGDLVSGRSHDYNLKIKTVHTSRKTLATEELLEFPSNHEVARTFSQVSQIGAIAAVAAQKLQERGAVILMHQTPDMVWSLARKLKTESNRMFGVSENIKVVQAFLRLEFGDTFELIELLSYGIGVHHAGLSDDVRLLMEWLFELGELKFLVATTTIAQGVNFPITGLVMASNQYPYGKDMPPEDFWNIAGRAGRISQNTLGVVLLVADTDAKQSRLESFINFQTGVLNSALLELASNASDLLRDLKQIVYYRPEWSTFVQYLAHTYRQMGNPVGFADQIEQVLRGTLGFEKLRSLNPSLALNLLDGIRDYIDYLQQPNQPLKLVDSTGFSLQSIKAVLSNASQEGIDNSKWNSESLFRGDNQDLQRMMGILLKVPELRKDLEAVTGGSSPDGQKLALIIKDWVNGVPVSEIAVRYFMREGDTMTDALTKCGKNLFGKLKQTASWGLGALLSMTAGDLSEDERLLLSNLPSRAFYGVNTDEAIVLRLLGVPRTAAGALASYLGNISTEPLSGVRERLMGLDADGWSAALGTTHGAVYRRIWRVLEGYPEV